MPSTAAPAVPLTPLAPLARGPVLAVAAGIGALLLVTSGRYGHFGGGHNYYLVGLYALCWAAAAVGLQQYPQGHLLRWVPTWPAYVVSAAVAVVVALPVRPVALLGRTDLAAGGSIGWPELADTVAATYQSLPPESRQDAVVVTANYWQAAAIDHFGPDRGLPRPYSPHRGYWYLGVPDDTSGVVILVGEDSGRIRQHFTDVRRTATVDNPRGIPVFNADLPVRVCSGQREPWSRLWPQVRDMLGAPVR